LKRKDEEVLNWFIYSPHFILLNLIDILIVTFLFYQLLVVIQGTRAVQILQGIVILLLTKLASAYWHLETLNWILKYLMLSIAVALPIVFQPELRRALEQLGRGGVARAAFPRLKKEEISKLIDEITWAVVVLSQTKTGALIVIERETGLVDFIEKGTRLEGEVSSKLLLSIFLPKSPLHDGAVIIRGLKIMAAGCYLPLSDNPWIDKSFGSRHRAALGITEDSDALAVIVSEETGEIAIAKEGKFIRNLDEAGVKNFLLTYLISISEITAIPLWKSIWKEDYKVRVQRIFQKKS
jgi:diadenylate cyclase